MSLPKQFLCLLFPIRWEALLPCWIMHLEHLNKKAILIQVVLILYLLMTIHIQVGFKTSNEIWKVIDHTSSLNARRSKNCIDDPPRSYQWRNFWSQKDYLPMNSWKSSFTLTFVYHFSLFQNFPLGTTCKYSISSLHKDWFRYVWPCHFPWLWVL
jgi:hypothetical protein